MNIDKLAQRVTKREGGAKEMNVAEVKEVLRCLNDQIHEDTGGGINLYSILRSTKEPGE